MITNKDKDRIISYYSDGSKHSNYQNYPSFVKNDIGQTSNINENWRGDSARYQYLLENLEFPDAIIVGDLGANNGKFCLELANAYKKSHFIAVEINQNSCDFIRLISEIYHITNLTVLNQSAGLQDLDKLPLFDVALNMNVLHHVGVDFEQDEVKSSEEIRNYLIRYFKTFAPRCKVMVFQMGYNWGGDKTQPIIPPDKIAEFIEFQEGIFRESNWKVDKLALYNHYNQTYFTVNVDDDLRNVIRQNQIIVNSEFYKRPLFILSSANK